MQEQETKTTPLHEWHIRSNASLAVFGGYEMPLWYASTKEEHLAVLLRAGLFDTSHMALIQIDGQDSRALLQYSFSRNLEKCLGSGKTPLRSGRSVYGVFLNQEGHVVDDAVLSQVSPTHYLAVVNAGMGPPITQHLQNHAADFSANITDRTDGVGKMDLQGPQSALILSRVLADPANVLVDLPYFSFKGDFPLENDARDTVRLRDGTPLLLSRSGYTGEFGFELFVPPHRTEDVWNQLLEAGRDHGLAPCGLAARDSLRAGAVLPLSHQDIGDWPFLNTPWDFALPWDEAGGGFNKPFVGAEALSCLHSAPVTLPFVGRDPRKVQTDESTRVADESGEELGSVLTCTTDMGIGWRGDSIFSVASPNKPDDFKPKGLCCGFVRVKRPIPANQALLLKDARRSIRVYSTHTIRPDRTARKPLREMLGNGRLD
jgi:aminomethyltransferase